MLSLIAGAGLLVLPLSAAQAAGDPTGVWFNDTGRGAIEIKPCGGALCGHVVWVKDPTDTKGCGRQIIGSAAKVGAGVWDNGWIYSPEKKQKYDVELKPLANGKLQVTGYAGTKLFSKTMIWTRAPADLARCGKPETIAKADPKAKPETKPDAKPKVEAKTEPKPKPKAVAKADPAPKVVPPEPKPAERPARAPDAPTEIAKADPESAAPAPAPVPAPAPEAAPEAPAPLPGVADDGEAPAPDASAEPPPVAENPIPEPVEPDAAEDEPAPRGLDMGKIAKKLAELERETGYGLKKTGNGNCRLNVPFATVDFPCKK
jgi:uncharacterized protein (DUF2147 family)